MNLGILGWILYPGAYLTLNFGGDGGGSGSASREDEDRKQALRTKIDRLYGIGSPVTKYKLSDGTLVDTKPAPVTTPVMTSEGQALTEGSNDDPGQPVYKTMQPDFTQVDLPDTEAADAAKQMESEKSQVADATRGYYSDQLSRSFAAAERNNRFRLARQGLQGGSADIDTNAQLQTDDNLGQTRIDDAARRAAAALATQREQERGNAVSLVNSGAGESAVASAQAGLRNSLDTVRNANKANLFSDLFAGAADTYANANQADLLSAMMGRYNQQLSYFYPNTGGGSGRVTPSG